MALSEEKIREYIKRLLIARMRILCNHGFYGLLLMHMIYSIDEGAPTAYTDGERIAFGPEFLDSLSDNELDCVMMHEILHVVLQHCLRGEYRDLERYNIAADIVVNSNIMLENDGKPSSITISGIGELMHKAPDGKEGHIYTAEEVYEMLPPSKNPLYKNTLPGFEHGRAKKEQQAPKNGEPTPGRWDDHSHWGIFEKDSVLRDVWVKQFAEACEAITVRDPSNSRGTLPMFAKRMLEKLMKPQTDWRTILNEFIQEEINDYSFSPPDRRFQDSPFFLPDFNEKGQTDEVENILFMIDTSGSISDRMMTAAYSEVKGAIDQFNGKLRGWLGFFDAAIIEPKPFSSFEEFIVIKPAGGGGTDFQIIFEYVHRYMEENPPVSIIILTDGFAPFPREELAGGIPVLWLINNEEVDPPWGKVARITVSADAPGK
ncbi:MAG: hypothetical protein IKI91_04110 [Clostridia bacterium]|nr:hypothetical protein [Clostridia bacterium]